MRPRILVRGSIARECGATLVVRVGSNRHTATSTLERRFFIAWANFYA